MCARRPAFPRPNAVCSDTVRPHRRGERELDRGSSAVEPRGFQHLSHERRADAGAPPARGGLLHRFRGQVPPRLSEAAALAQGPRAGGGASAAARVGASWVNTQWPPSAPAAAARRTRAVRRLGRRVQLRGAAPSRAQPLGLRARRGAMGWQQADRAQPAPSGVDGGARRRADARRGGAAPTVLPLFRGHRAARAVRAAGLAASKRCRAQRRPLPPCPPKETRHPRLHSARR